MAAAEVLVATGQLAKVLKEKAKIKNPQLLMRVFYLT
jgi:hypothetical protein